MFLFNTTTGYSINDLKRLLPIESYGLDDSFYGGRVTHIGETDNDVLLLISNREPGEEGGLKLIDTAALRLDNVPARSLRALAKKRKLKFDTKTPKEDLIIMLGGESIAKSKNGQAQDAGRPHDV